LDWSRMWQRSLNARQLVTKDCIRAGCELAVTVAHLSSYMWLCGQRNRFIRCIPF
jgi:hypothetical protein